jgi:hydrogenase-4 component B
MVCFLVALAVFLVGGIAAVVVGRSAKFASLVGAGSATIGAGLAMLPSLRVLLSGKSESLTLAWPMPFGSANMELDPLSALFAAIISLVTALAAIYGRQYLQAHAAGKSQGFSWLSFNLLAVGMLVVVAARNGVLFLTSWELMSLASFFLVTHDDEKENVRRAGWVYLIAMHLGTAFLLALFLLLGKGAESLDFDQFSTAAAPSGVFFVLAVIGFGTKAGFIPMHVWLPEAHPAAPSHVSAVMSGVMIKTGIYGLLRILTLLGEPPAWWGWTLLGVGVVSGVLGVLYALAQHDLKRLLAYHSVENIGIISLGLGVGVLGLAYNNPMMAALGFTGGLLHVVNHAIFKSLLFLGAGAVLHATGTGELDRLGGLLKRMPVTGATFLVGAAAIAGLPPLNGFVSEFLIYLGAIAGLDNSPSLASATMLATIAVVGGLALIGGLATACFTKAFGIVFLGEPRSDEASHAREAGAAMRWPMIALAGLCIAIGLTAPLWPTILRPAVQVVVGTQGSFNISAASAGPLTGIILASYVLLGLIVLLVQVRSRLLAGRRIDRATTWDCGYVAPTPRMQYTASSFARPIVILFRLFLRPRDEIHPPQGLFPKHAALHTHAPDVFRSYIYEPLFLGVAWAASKLRWLQEGRIQIYVLYIAMTILALLIWKLG